MKDSSLERSQDTLRGISLTRHSQVKGGRCISNCNRQVCSLTSAGGTSLRRPLGVISQNTMCNSVRKSISNSSGIKGKKTCVSVPSSIHQGEEGPLDIWAVIKPGNTKEKIAFFAAHQCNNRSGTMKLKGNWDVDGTAAKRRKKSVDHEKVKFPSNRTKESVREENKKCLLLESPCTFEHCSLNCENDNGELCPARSLSVTEIVAFLEQKASALLANCSKTCTNSQVKVQSSGQCKGLFPMPESNSVFKISLTCPEKGIPENGEHTNECVRVLDMVAKLESECLKQQSEREAGTLSRNNSLRRNVGKVLLASNAQPEKNYNSTEASNISLEALNVEAQLNKSAGANNSCKFVCSDTRENNASGTTQEAGSEGLVLELHKSELVVPCESTATLKNKLSCTVTYTGPLISKSECTEFASDIVENKHRSICAEKENVNFIAQNVIERVSKEMVCTVSLTGSKNKCELVNSTTLDLCEEPLPGMLFFCKRESQSQPKIIDLSSSDGCAQTLTKCVGSDLTNAPLNRTLSSVKQCPNLLFSTEGTHQTLEHFSLKRQVSHEFLEARFKLQQLLEPQQYMPFLPHHILVKMFAFLSTKTLVALKCTCHYFKFIIENYDIRPADSCWVRDPRYKDDPCKQCKRRYKKGDVSLCLWHPKPYCQALPYGPGYWMCCHSSQKDAPGCKVGLHDNRWVPACHSINMPLYKKAKDSESDED